MESTLTPQVRIRMPAALQPLSGGAAEVALCAETVGDAVDALLAAHPRIRRHLLADDGSVRGYVNLYLNDEDVRALQWLATPVRDGDTILIVPSVAGG